MKLMKQYCKQLNKKVKEGKTMLSFFICLLLLIGGYFVYGKVVENTFAPDDGDTGC